MADVEEEEDSVLVDRPLAPNCMRKTRFVGLLAPSPTSPAKARAVATAFALCDALLAVGAALRRQKILSAVCGLRLAAALTRDALVPPERQSAAVVASAMASLLLLARKNRLAALLGALQLLAWALARPATLPFIVMRTAGIALSSVYFAVFPAASAAPLSKEWISRALGTTHVASVRVEPLSKKSTEDVEEEGPRGFIGEMVRVHVKYDGNDDNFAHDLPLTLVAKLATKNLYMRIKMRLVAVYSREARFYCEIAPKILAAADKIDGKMLQTPRVYAVQYDDLNADSCLLMEDLAPLAPGDEVQGATWQKACSVATRYARFHALYWSPSLSALDERHGLGWQSTYDWMRIHPLIVQDIVEKAFDRLMTQQRFNKLVSPNIQQALRHFIQNLDLVFQELETGPVTFIHADSRMENMLWPSRLERGKVEDKICHPGLRFDDMYDRLNISWYSVDWQTSTKGKGVYDLAYFVALDLEMAPDTGTYCDKTLVENYHQHLGAAVARLRNGEPLGYDLKQCWRDYRLAMFLAALIPIAVMQPESIGTDGLERAQRVREFMLFRCTRAIERVDAIEVLRELVDSKITKSKMHGALTQYRQVEDQLLEDDREEDPLNRSGESLVVLRSATAQDERLGHHSPASLASFPPGRGPKPGAGRRDAYDRWFLNGYDPTGRYFFAAALGLYPDRRVVDASFSFVVDGVQHNVRASRHLTEEEWPSVLLPGPMYVASGNLYIPDVKSQVGPIEILPKNPLNAVELIVCLPGEVIANLTFKARYSPSMEPPYNMNLGQIGEFHYDRLTQLVTWEGNIKIKENPPIPVTNWYGCRDRSWGRRPHVHADNSPERNLLRSKIAGNKMIRSLMSKLIQGKRSPQFYWFWSPINLGGGGIVYHSQQNRDGTVDNGNAHIFGDPFQEVADEMDRTSSSQNKRPSRRSGTAGDVLQKAFAYSSGTSMRNESSRYSGFVSPHAPYGKVESAGHSVQYRQNSRHLEKCTIVMALQDGRRVTLSCEPLFPFFMSGIGYNHPTFGHGTRHDSQLVVHVDTIHTHLADRNQPLFWHVQEVSRITADLYAKDAGQDDVPIATAVGISAVEQLVLGPHEPSGFKGFFDC